MLVGSSCRFKVVKWLRKKFDDPKAAETFYSSSNVSVGVQVSVASLSVGVQTTSEMQVSGVAKRSNTPMFKDAGVQTDQWKDPDCVIDLQAMSVAFSKYCRQELGVEVCDDFLHLSSSAMFRLTAGNRSNVVYNLAKGIGTCRRDSTESRFPVGKMPMGLVEYTANFFAAEDINSVDNYVQCKA